MEKISSSRRLKERRAASPAVSPSILAALLICCIVDNTAHVVNFYPFSSNFSFVLVSYRMVVISACSWPSHRSFLFNNYYPLIVIVLTRPRSRHVVRPSVMMILVSFTRSSHTSDDSWILTKPPAGITWFRNQVFPTLFAFLAHKGGEGHMQPLASRALPTTYLYT